MDRPSLLAIAGEAAEEAAALLRGEWTAELGVRDKAEEKGIVTDLDLAAESCIRDAILIRRPQDGVLGEELGAVPGSSGVEWIVDPLDGTNNFIAGSPQWAVSIAARVRGRLEVAVVNMPLLEQVYTAIAGVGAWSNGQPLASRAAYVCRLEEAVVATGFCSQRDRRAGQLEQLERVLGVARDVRCKGAASAELCGVAAGEADAYYETELQLWDVAAAGLVAVEAGLEVSGSPWSDTGTLVAAPPSLAVSLRRVVDPGSEDV